MDRLSLESKAVGSGIGRKKESGTMAFHAAINAELDKFWSRRKRKNFNKNS